MKSLQLWLIAACGVLLLGCPQPLPPELQNRPPEIPEVIFPQNGAEKIATEIVLRWKMSDPNEFDTLYCDVYLGESESSLQKIKSNWRADTCKITSLQFNKEYFWRIVVRDQGKLETEGPIWSFRTRVENNNPPNAPANPIPANHQTDVPFYKTNFAWRGGDPDDFSVVTYDVYLGNSADSLKLWKSQIPDTSFTHDLLLFDTKYFWQIVAKDDYDSVSAGPIWDFITEKGDLKFWEPFDAYPTGQSPPVPPWTIAQLNSRIFVTDTQSHNGAGKSICLIDSTLEGYALVASRFEQITRGMISFYWKTSSQDDFLGLRLYSGNPDSSHLGPQISIRGTKMQFFNQDNAWHDITPVKPDQWYFIQIVFSCQDKIFHLYVNNVLKVDNGSWTGTGVSYLDSIYFLTFENRTCQAGYVDEIKIYAK